MLGMAAMLASCGQDELGGAQTGGAVTITATVDNGIGSRASTYDTDDVTIDQCLLEVYDAGGSTLVAQAEGVQGAQEGTFTFTVGGLDPEAQYDFLFWADNKAAAAYAGTLKGRALAGGADLSQALAFQGRIEGATADEATAVTLTHAVAKVTLKTTGALAAGDKVTLSMAGVAGTWDVLGGTATGDATAEYAHTLASAIAQPQDAAEVATFYVPAPTLGSTHDVAIGYASADGAKAGNAAVTNVPLKANYRTVIKGDVAALYEGATASITAQLNSQWSDPDSEVEFPLQAIAACEGLEINLDLSQATLQNDEGQAITEFPRTLYEGNYTDKSKAILTGIILPSGIESLAKSCFLRCKSLASVTLPEGLKTIGVSAFQYTAITSIDFPESLTTINGSAFADSKLEGELIIPEHITFPSETRSPYATTVSVFSTTNLTSVVWNSPSPIQNNTFRKNTALKTVTINGKCTGIDNNAFYGCTIDELTINTEAPIEFGRDKSTGFNEATVKSIKVPAEQVETYKSATGWSYYKDIITAIN